MADASNQQSSVWYEVVLWSPKPDVRPVCVVRETPHHVALVDDRPGSLRQKGAIYHRTWADAHAQLMNYLSFDMERAEHAMARARVRLDCAKAMQPPPGAEAATKEGGQ